MMGIKRGERPPDAVLSRTLSTTFRSIMDKS
jgi:hypothetical protein